MSLAFILISDHRRANWMPHEQTTSEINSEAPMLSLHEQGEQFFILWNWAFWAKVWLAVQVSILGK